MISSLIFEAAAPLLLTFGCAAGVEAADATGAQQSTITVHCSNTDSAGMDEIRRATLIGQTSCHRPPSTTGNKQTSASSPIGVINPLVPVYVPGSQDGIGGADLTPVPPRIALYATPAVVEAGQSATLSWESNEMDTCEATEGWSGFKPVEGSESTGALNQNTVYKLTCRGASGFAIDTVTVAVEGGAPVPVVNISANPGSVTAGSASTLSWSTQYASACIASGAWAGSTPIAGSESTGALSQTSTYELSCLGDGGVTTSSVTVNVSAGVQPPVSFTKVLIDNDQAAWGKNFADVNGDGKLDIIEGGGGLGTKVYWYRNPDWQRFLVGNGGGGDDIQSADINGDGALDIVVNGIPMSWYENPAGSGGNVQGTWQRREIVSYRGHDISLKDIDRDGKIDIVLRQADSGTPGTRLFLQANNNQWTYVPLWNQTQGTGGLAVADIDDDGRLDVVGDGYWLRQPATNITNGNAWTRYEIDSWPAGSSIDTADINKDGRLDVTLAVSEVGTGDFAWFEAPVDPLTQPWIRHQIDIVEDVHRHHIVDFNQDGELDIVFAEMYQSQTDRVGVYYNQGNGESWILDILETHGSHNLAVGDVDNDGDIDFVGANWRLQGPADGDLFLWRNNKND
jgi:hypothetical protein